MKGKATPQEMEWFEVMKRVRNLLAHRTPVSYKDIVAAERLTRKLIRGRT